MLRAGCPFPLGGSGTTEDAESAKADTDVLETFPLVSVRPSVNFVLFVVPLPSRNVDNMYYVCITMFDARNRHPKRMTVVLALGFDLFFKPKLTQAAQQAGVEVRYAQPAQAAEAAAGAARVVADASAPGVQDALAAVRRAHPALPILACYPHVEAQRAEFVRGLGGVAVTRGLFAQRLPEALAGTLGG